MNEPVNAVIFEGGSPGSLVERELAAVRAAALLDNLDKLNRVKEIGQVYLATNNRRLAELARAKGATVAVNRLLPRSFHFGEELKRLVLKHRLSKVFYFSGAGCPLIKEEEISAICRRLSGGTGRLITNNIQSADLVAFNISGAFNRIELPAMDNVLATALRDRLGLKLELTPLSPGLLFDLDTPIDALVLGDSPFAGARTRACLAELDWDYSRLRRAKQVLNGNYREIVLIGRVGAPVMERLNSRLRIRLRVFSEERGMKALGRLERKEVASLMGYLLERAGLPDFFHYLSRVADAAFIDSRLFMAHNRYSFSDRERFLSDLGRFEEIEHPWLKNFTREAFFCPIPVLLGGHSLVSGSLWAIAEELNPGNNCL